MFPRVGSERPREAQEPRKAQRRPWGGPRSPERPREAQRKAPGDAHECLRKPLNKLYLRDIFWE